MVVAHIQRVHDPAVHQMQFESISFLTVAYAFRTKISVNVLTNKKSVKGKPTNRMLFLVCFISTKNIC